MTRKYPKTQPCPLCKSKAHMAECYISARDKTLYAVVCDNECCRMSEVPPSWMCFRTEDEAVADWNRIPR